MNRIRGRIAFTALLLALTVFPSAAGAQSKLGSLVVEVSLEGKARLGSEVQFFVEIRNQGTSPLMLPTRPGWDAEGGLELHVTAAGGQSFKAPPREDSSRNRSLPADRRAVSLPAGNAMGVYRTAKTNEIFTTPGEYRVSVTYRGINGAVTTSEPILVSVTR
ncbi:hypothetical protein [Arenimonas sp. MALMAid1274]|uniref:hypothetical protein n=1 Tax=Arenimonas sp. MALMAid1274 TaxID=3411630 RepID=UPI003B9EFDA4